MRTALTADWIMPAGGAEQVIGAFAEIFPDAPIMTTVAAAKVPVGIDRSRVRSSGLQFLYNIIGRHQPLLPWMPLAMESFDLSFYDVILSSSHAVAKGVIPPPGAVHVCYCHTPMRYAWFMEDDYLRDFHVPRILWPLIRWQLRRIRAWDLSTAKRVDLFLANSQTTANRIKQIYGRNSTVVHPPVDDRFFNVPLSPITDRKGFVAVGRLVPYKRFDLLIAAANEGKFSLTIVGTGKEEQRLRAMAGPTVAFRGHVADAELPSLYATAEAVLFPQEEDAGIVLLEAQACGTPVIALGKGGALDLTMEGKTSMLFSEQSVSAILAALVHFRAKTFDPKTIRDHVSDCRRSKFQERIRSIVSGARAEFDAGTFSRR